MKCPFVLPVKTNVSPVDPNLRYVSSVDRSKVGYIFGDCNKDYADYIVTIINSHKKLVNLLIDAQRYIRPKDPKYIEIEQALKESENPK